MTSISRRAPRYVSYEDGFDHSCSRLVVETPRTTRARRFRSAVQHGAVRCFRRGCSTWSECPGPSPWSSESVATAVYRERSVMPSILDSVSRP